MSAIDEMLARSRQRHPERYAPDGTPLMDVHGTDWDDRRLTWAKRHPEHPESAGIIRAAHEKTTLTKVENTWSDGPESREVPAS